MYTYIHCMCLVAGDPVAAPLLPSKPAAPLAHTHTHSFISLFSSLGYLPAYDAATLLPPLVAICAVCAAVESLPINSVLDDNFSVPAVALVLSLLLLPAS